MYGIEIHPDNGKTYVFTENTMFVTVGKGGRVGSGLVTSFDTGFDLPYGYDAFLWNDAFLAGFDFSLALEGRRVHIRANDGGAIPDMQYEIMMIPSLTELNGVYGLGVFGNRSRFQSLPTGQYTTAPVWVGTVTLHNNWRPSDVYPAYNPATDLVFFYQEDHTYSIARKPVTLDSNDFVYGLLKDGNEGFEHSGQMNCKAVIMGRKVITPDKYGINIYAQNGELVFTSSQIMVAYGQTFVMPGTGDYAVPNIGRPMFLPAFVHLHNDEYWALTSKGGALGTIHSVYPPQFMPFPDTQNSNPHIVIDANHYFTF